MRNRLVVICLLILIAGAIPAWAQNDALRGTWSGHWAPGGTGRDAVTVRFSIVDGQLTGEIVNPENLDFSSLSFDASSLSVTAEATGGEDGPYRIEARIDDETRLNGTLSSGTTSGEMRLTKWTYVPRIR